LFVLQKLLKHKNPPVIVNGDKNVRPQKPAVKKALMPGPKHLPKLTAPPRRRAWLGQ
jgi:exonuclease III